MNAASDREAWARIIDPEAWRALEGPWQDDSRWVSEDHRKNCLAERQGYALAKADALLALPSSREQRLVEALRLASDTLTAAIEVADQARDEWDTAPAGMKAGKILIALSGQAPGYRIDTDAIHANRQRIAALLAELGEQDRSDLPPLGRYCPACEAIPTLGYCGLAGCPTAPKPDSQNTEGES
jgi:hypothetical protein